MPLENTYLACKCGTRFHRLPTPALNPIPNAKCKPYPYHKSITIYPLTPQTLSLTLSETFTLTMFSKNFYSGCKSKRKMQMTGYQL